MKVLKGTQAFIKGKIYPEGSQIPKEHEQEFEKFLVEVNTDSASVIPSPVIDTMPEKKSKKKSNKKEGK